MNPGIYSGNYKSATTTQSGANKTDTLAIVYEITHVSEGSDWAEIPPIERTVFLYLSEKAWERSKADLERLGFNGDFDKPDFTEKRVDLEAYNDTYNGQTKLKWRLAGGGGSFQAEPADATVTRRLNAMWKQDKPKAKPTGRPATPPKKPSVKENAAAMAAQAPADGDSVPF